MQEQSIRIGSENREVLYGVWADMNARCRNPAHHAFEYYGGRGIRVHDEWKSYYEFRAWALAHGYADGLTIDRTDNDGPYAPDNCRWVDRLTQMNNRRSNHWVEAFGERHTIAQWSRDPRCVVTGRQLNKRIANGWEPERALDTPAQEDRFVTAFGETKSLLAWARDPRCMVSRDAVSDRIFDRQWPAERAITTPRQPRGPSRPRL